MQNNSTEDTTKKVDNQEEEKELINTINQLLIESENERNNFSDSWLAVEEQINCIPPAEWAEKEDWQTKVYIPSQFKVSETASAIMGELCFGQRDFFAVMGIDNDTDRAKETELKRFMMVLLERGGFFRENGYVLQQGVNIGTSYLKILVNPKTGVDFIWKSANDCFSDPQAVTAFNKSKYFIEEYNEDIADIVKNPLYDKEKVDEMLVSLSGTVNMAEKSKLICIKNVEGNAEYLISDTYKAMNMKEFWGYIPVKKTKMVKDQEVEYYEYDMRAVTIANNQFILRNDHSDYKSIPYERMIVKRRLNHGYGNGFCANLSGLQDLINSIVNLGFDSAKLKGIGIVVVDENGVADASSIQIKPMAKWLMKQGGMDSVRVEYLGEDNIRNTITDTMFIDEMIQDASGVTRHYQSSDAPQGGEETLGQTKIKMAAAERRFLKTTKEISEDYVVPVLSHLFEIITNPKFVDFFQEMFDRVIGMKLEDNPENIQIMKDSITNGTKPQLKPPIPKRKLELKDLGEVNLDFKFTGLTNFQQKSVVPEQMNQILKISRDDPSLGMFIKKDQALKRWMQASEVADVDDLLVGIEERKELQQGLVNQFQAQGQMPQKMLAGQPMSPDQTGGASAGAPIPGQQGEGQPPVDINPEKIQLQIDSILNKGK